MLFILVVLYNKTLQESDTLCSLMYSDFCSADISLIIWDNSIKKIDYRDYHQLSKKFNLTYSHTPENISLSKIYNLVFEKYLNKNDFLLILDDDSQFDNNFLKTIAITIAEQQQIYLALPVVMVKQKIISPAKTYAIKNAFFKSLNAGILNAKNITAINSGMVISKRIYEMGFKYDENLKFYGTDNYFMHWYRKNFKTLYILDAVIHQNLSFESEGLEKKASIFSESKKANLLIYKNEPINFMLAQFNNFIVSLLFAIRFRSVKFLK